MPMRNPPHPGRSILRDCIEPLGMSVEEAAKELNVSFEDLWGLIRGESSITFPLAVRLDKLFGGGASTWYELQARYDEAQARKTEDGSGGPEPLIVHQQTATVPLKHGRTVYRNYDSDVMELCVVRSDDPGFSNDPDYDRVGFRFVGEGPGAVRIQMIYQPSLDITPRLVADVLLKAYLQWNAEADEYVGRIDAGEWNRETQKLHDGKKIMNALYYELQDASSVPTLNAESSGESNLEHHTNVLREAEELLHRGTDSVRTLTLSEV